MYKRLSQWAKENEITYYSAWRMFKSGKLKGYKLPSGTIIITENEKSLEDVLKIIKEFCNNEDKFKKIKEILEC